MQFTYRQNLPILVQRAVTQNLQIPSYQSLSSSSNGAVTTLNPQNVSVSRESSKNRILNFQPLSWLSNTAATKLAKLNTRRRRLSRKPSKRRSLNIHKPLSRTFVGRTEKLLFKPRGSDYLKRIPPWMQKENETKMEIKNLMKNDNVTMADKGKLKSNNSAKNVSPIPRAAENKESKKAQPDVKSEGEKKLSKHNSTEMQNKKEQHSSLKSALNPKKETQNKRMSENVASKDKVISFSKPSVNSPRLYPFINLDKLKSEPKQAIKGRKKSSDYKSSYSKGIKMNAVEEARKQKTQDEISLSELLMSNKAKDHSDIDEINKILENGVNKDDSKAEKEKLNTTKQVASDKKTTDIEKLKNWKDIVKRYEKIEQMAKRIKLRSDSRDKMTIKINPKPVKFSSKELLYSKGSAKKELKETEKKKLNKPQFVSSASVKLQEKRQGKMSYGEFIASRNLNGLPSKPSVLKTESPSKSAGKLKTIDSTLNKSNEESEEVKKIELKSTAGKINSSDKESSRRKETVEDGGKNKDSIKNKTQTIDLSPKAKDTSQVTRKKYKLIEEKSEKKEQVVSEEKTTTQNAEKSFEARNQIAEIEYMGPKKKAPQLTPMQKKLINEIIKKRKAEVAESLKRNELRLEAKKKNSQKQSIDLLPKEKEISQVTRKKYNLVEEKAETKGQGVGGSEKENPNMQNAEKSVEAQLINERIMKRKEEIAESLKKSDQLNTKKKGEQRHDTTKKSEQRLDTKKKRTHKKKKDKRGKNKKRKEKKLATASNKSKRAESVSAVRSQASENLPEIDKDLKSQLASNATKQAHYKQKPIFDDQQQFRKEHDYANWGDSSKEKHPARSPHLSLSESLQKIFLNTAAVGKAGLSSYGNVTFSPPRFESPQAHLKKFGFPVIENSENAQIPPRNDLHSRSVFDDSYAKQKNQNLTTEIQLQLQKKTQNLQRNEALQPKPPLITISPKTVENSGQNEPIKSREIVDETMMSRFKNIPERLIPFYQRLFTTNKIDKQQMQTTAEVNKHTSEIKSLSDGNLKTQDLQQRNTSQPDFTANNNRELIQSENLRNESFNYQYKKNESSKQDSGNLGNQYNVNKSSKYNEKKVEADLFDNTKESKLSRPKKEVQLIKTDLVNKSNALSQLTKSQKSAISINDYFAKKAKDIAVKCNSMSKRIKCSYKTMIRSYGLGHKIKTEKQKNEKYRPDRKNKIKPYPTITYSSKKNKMYSKCPQNHQIHTEVIKRVDNNKIRTPKYNRSGQTRTNIAVVHVEPLRMTGQPGALVTQFKHSRKLNTPQPPLAYSEVLNAMYGQKRIGITTNKKL